VELEIIVVDTSGETAIAHDLAGVSGASVLELPAGTGFCTAINAAYAASAGQFVFVTNDDVFATPTYLACLVNALERRPRAGLVTGKLLRYDLVNNVATSIIDTTGHVISRSRRVADRGEGQSDCGQFEHEEEVFGVSGAALVAPRHVLDGAALGGKILDESFHMYKDDVDLSWRVRLLGWECWYVPEAVAYHARTSRGRGRSSYFVELRAFQTNERLKPAHVRIHSMKNQWLMIIKNDHALNIARDIARIVGREVLVLAYNTVTTPRQTLTAIELFVRALPVALRSRRELKRRRGVPAVALRRWFAREGHPCVSPAARPLASRGRV